MAARVEGRAAKSAQSHHASPPPPIPFSRLELLLLPNSSKPASLVPQIQQQSTGYCTDALLTSPFTGRVARPCCPSTGTAASSKERHSRTSSTSIRSNCNSPITTSLAHSILRANSPRNIVNTARRWRTTADGVRMSLRISRISMRFLRQRTCRAPTGTTLSTMI